MDWAQTLTLAVVQGLTEFLPVSSSAHLLLFSHFLGWPAQSLAFDVAVHGGSLFAVIVHFRAQLMEIARAMLAQLAGKGGSASAYLGWMLALATCPAGLAGLLLDGAVEAHMRSVAVIAWASIGFALMLWLAERMGSRSVNDLTRVRWRGALAVGCAQALALIPGASRAGVTISAGMLLGLTRSAASRFAFLLAIPLISAAVFLKAAQLADSDGPVEWNLFCAGMLVSGLTAYLSIHWFLKLVERVGLAPFILYRILLGCALLAL